MSRVGNKLIKLNENVTVDVQEGNFVVVKGPKGELSAKLASEISIEISEGQIKLVRPNDTIRIKTLHGTTRALLNNMVVGVSEGYSKTLLIEGVGYRAQMQGNVLVVSAGYSHPVNMPIPAGLTVTCPSQTEIHVLGCDKQLVGEFAANARKVRGPEPYKGKGIHYRGEYIRRKEGKKAK